MFALYKIYFALFHHLILLYCIFEEANMKPT